MKHAYYFYMMLSDKKSAPPQKTLSPPSAVIMTDVESYLRECFRLISLSTTFGFNRLLEINSPHLFHIVPVWSDVGGVAGTNFLQHKSAVVPPPTHRFIHWLQRPPCQAPPAHREQ